MIARRRLQVLLLVAGTTAAIGFAAPAPAARAVPAVAAAVPNPSSWLDQLRELICRLYKAWGGDCEGLGQVPADWISALWSTYEAKGPPTFSDPSAQAKFLADLEALEDHLDDPANSLGSSDEAALRGLIDALRGDVGGA